MKEHTKYDQKGHLRPKLGHVYRYCFWFYRQLMRNIEPFNFNHRVFSCFLINWSDLCTISFRFPVNTRSATVLKIVALIVCLLVTSNSFADGHPEITRFCSWKANAARVITMNRDIGLNEIEITGYYIEQGSSYEEQKIVLTLIDKIYGPYEFITNNTIYSQTRETCVRDFYLYPSKEVANYQH